ncbi:hypothetical protein EQW78_05265 [Oerskovia turbata]|uniref:Tetratricopeptide repeat protein n=1 Tax=Oerskovia turbata TaxID=1713 RepID=A0A4Q1KZ95_9CELL|nr:hypothetical protein [Oerskovia turbata]RXR27831.1 hypothetical protein EQW73_00485 [Oerskovia turbata]RXR35731.1 hypothetical protein EQW78_05265 [Oerskovia turbata]
MTRTVHEANEALFRVREMPYGVARSTAAEAELARITADGPVEARAYALFVLVESYVWGNEVTKAYLPFTQLLRWWDEHPEHFDEQDTHSLFWSFKWMVGNLMDFPAVPAAQIERTLDDMERRYAVAGNGMNAVTMSRFQWARARGTQDTAAAYEAWVATPRDDFSQCEACEPGDRAAYLFDTGRLEEGIRLLEQVLAGSPECATEPGDMLSRLQLAYLETGDADKAAATHRRGLRHLDNGVAMEGPQGRHIEFLARTGNVERALTRIVEHQDHLVTADSPRDRWAFLLSVGTATSLLAAEHGERPIALREVPASTVAELDTWVRAQAREIAAAFDARNGTDATTRRTEKVWAGTPTLLPVSLGVLGATDADVSALVRDTAVVVPDPVAEPATDGAQVGGVAALVAHAETLSTDDPAGAAGAYQRAAALFEAEGALDQAGFALAEAAQLAAGEQDVEGALAAFPRAVALLRAGGVDPAFRGPVVRAYARLTARAGTAAAGLAAVDKALTETGSAPAEGSVGAEDERAARERRELLDTRARLLATLGEHERASSSAEAAAEEFARAGDLDGAAHAFWLAGTTRADAGDHEGAVLALEAALDGFRLAHDQASRALVGNELVTVLRRLGRDDDAGQVAESVSRR